MVIDEKGKMENKKMGEPAVEDTTDEFGLEVIERNALEIQLNEIMRRRGITREDAIESLRRLEHHPILSEVDQILIDATKEMIDEPKDEKE